MKKILLTKVLSVMSAALLLFGTLYSNQTNASVDEGAGGPKIKCPEGDTYKCYTQGTDLVVYKGKGEATVEP